LVLVCGISCRLNLEIVKSFCISAGVWVLSNLKLEISCQSDSYFLAFGALGFSSGEIIQFFVVTDFAGTECGLGSCRITFEIYKRLLMNSLLEPFIDSMIPPVQQWISPDRNRPVQSRSSPRNFWTGIGPIPDADRLDWAWSGPIPHDVQS